MDTGRPGNSSVHTVKVCSFLPPNINSRGVWGKTSPLEYSLPRLQAQMLLIFVVTQAVHLILKRFGQPNIVSQIIAGLILGPSVLGRIRDFETSVFSLDSQEIIGTLSLFGYSLFMFLIGVKMDVGMIRKTGRKALATGIIALVVPLMVGVLSTRVLIIFMEDEGKSTSYLLYMTAILSLTSFPVISCLLSDLNLLNSELGRLALSAAIVSDLISVVLVMLGTLGKTGQEISYIIAGFDVVTTVSFIIGAVYIFRPAMYWVIRRTPEGRPVKDGYIMSILLAVLLSGLVSNQFRQTVVFGPYVLGLVVPDGPPLGSTLVDKFESFVSGLLMPLFITTSALRTDLFSIEFKSNQLLVNASLVVIIFSVKIIASMLPPLYCKVPFYDALTLALIMSCKGMVELSTYSFLRDSEFFNQETFAVMVISTLLAASVVPTLVQRLYDPSRKYAGYQRRTIMHWRPDSELRVLACIHRADTISAMINLLDATCPTRDSPVAIYVLHLIELAGRATPLFISHQIQKKIVSNHTFSENVVLAFNNYERNNPGAVTVQAFTAISPPKLMHEDICTLALNKLTSLIIIPFHRKWAIDGSIESEDRNLRNLINSVLERAPCSVAILVDRGHLGQSTSVVSSQSAYCIAMLFFGGNDDREALSFAKCMARDSSIKLTVVHFIAVDDDDASTDWEKMLDSEVLKDIKLKNVDHGHVVFMEERVKDGPQTALIVRSMVDEYDLIIVGRRHNVESPQTSGLIEWCEFPELGIIGDLLASSDLHSKACVLVVQQQQLLS